MKYLLDTCVLSELIKKQPDLKVEEWISRINESDLFISVLTIGELHKGIAKLPDSIKKSELHKWVSHDLESRFQSRIIDIDLKTSTIWGKIMAESELKGRTMPAIDSLIAATGISHNLVVVTRNTKDMEISNVDLFNPWIEVEHLSANN